MNIGFEPDILSEYQRLSATEVNLAAQVELLNQMYSTTKNVVEKYQGELQAKRAEAEAKKAEKAASVAALKEKLSQMELELENSVIEGIAVRQVLEPEFGKVVDDNYLSSLEMPVKVKLLTTSVSEIERIKSAQEHDKLCKVELPARLCAIEDAMTVLKPSWKVANDLRGRICAVQSEIYDAGVSKPSASLRQRLSTLWRQFDEFKERCPAENNLQRELKKLK